MMALASFHLAWIDASDLDLFSPLVGENREVVAQIAVATKRYLQVGEIDSVS